MGASVTFSYAAWIALFPEFATTVTQNQATGVLLPVAEVYVRNDGVGPVQDPKIQATLLNLMMAHVAQLTFGSATAGQTQGQQSSPLVGRVSSASEGSVSLSTDYPANPSDAWFVQTKYGALFLQASRPYRSMRYVAAPRRSFYGSPFGPRRW